MNSFNLECGWHWRTAVILLNIAFFFEHMKQNKICKLYLHRKEWKGKDF